MGLSDHVPNAYTSYPVFTSFWSCSRSPSRGGITVVAGGYAK
jgi:hypothetical protein